MDITMTRRMTLMLLGVLCCLSASARAALSIDPLLYGIERGFYRDEGIDLV